MTWPKGWIEVHTNGYTLKTGTEVLLFYPIVKGNILLCKILSNIYLFRSCVKIMRTLLLLSTLQSLLLKDSLTWLLICLMISLLTLFELRADPSSEYLLGYVLLKLLFTMWYIRQKTVNGLNSKVKLFC